MNIRLWKDPPTCVEKHKCFRPQKYNIVLFLLMLNVFKQVLISVSSNIFDFYSSVIFCKSSCLLKSKANLTAVKLYVGSVQIRQQQEANLGFVFSSRGTQHVKMDVLLSIKVIRNNKYLTISRCLIWENKPT